MFRFPQKDSLIVLWTTGWQVVSVAFSSHIWLIVYKMSENSETCPSRFPPSPMWFLRLFVLSDRQNQTDDHHHCHRHQLNVLAFLLKTYLNYYSWLTKTCVVHVLAFFPQIFQHHVMVVLSWSWAPFFMFWSNLVLSSETTICRVVFSYLESELFRLACGKEGK